MNEMFITLMIVFGFAHAFSMVFVAFSVSKRNRANAWFHPLWFFLDRIEPGIGPACAIGRRTVAGFVGSFLALRSF